MGSFYSFIIPNNETIAQQPCGQAGCCSLYPHLKQLTWNSNSLDSSDKNMPPIISRSVPKKSTRRRSISQQKRSTLLNKDEEDLLDQVLDAYITHKGSQHRMAQTLAHQLNADRTKMETLCCTLCELIEAKVHANN